MRRKHHQVSPGPWPRQRSAAPQGDRFALDRLVDYIEYHIAMAPSSLRPCACQDCTDLTVGIVGEMCSECESDGCEYGEECNREDAYGDGVDMIDDVVCD